MWAVGQAGFTSLTEGLKGREEVGYGADAGARPWSGSPVGRPRASSPTFVSTVWLGIMLPVLGIKSLSSFAITYLDRLLQ